MALFNPLPSVLKVNKLTGLNYIDCKHNLDNVPRTEECKCVLYEECPPRLDNDVLKKELGAYHKWVEVDEMSCGYILALVIGVFQHQHQTMPTDYDTVQSLKKLFGTQGQVGRESATRFLLNTSMSEGNLRRQAYVHIAEK